MKLLLFVGLLSFSAFAQEVPPSIGTSVTYTFDNVDAGPSAKISDLTVLGIDNKIASLK
jgi:hypothetical protein